MLRPINGRLIAAVALGAAASLVAVTSPPAALGSPLRVIAPSVTAFSSDGSHDVAWQTRENGPIEILDTFTGRRANIVPPSGCRLDDEGEGGVYVPTAAAGRFLLECLAAERSAVLDIRTGRARQLPGTGWYRLGARYARGNSAREQQVVVNLATHSVRRVGQEESVDLDRRGAPGERSICSALRGAVRYEELELLGNFSYRDGLYVHQLGSHGNVQIARCRSRPTVLSGQFIKHRSDLHAPRSFDLRGGLLSWDTGVSADTVTEPDSGRGSAPSKLFAFGLLSHRLRSFRLPRISVKDSTEGPVRCSYGYSAHTSNELFWIATRTLAGTESGPVVETMSVYAARL